MKIGELIKTWRDAERVTLRELAPEIGIPVPTLNRVEKGEPMDGRTLAKVITWMVAK
jgi:transcriptional regulator with XRE-family HTH domain